MKLTASKTIEKTQSNVTSKNPPTVPTKGQQWIDTSGDFPVLKEWNGAKWEEVQVNIEKLDSVTIGKINSSIEEAEKETEKAKQDAEQARQEAENAINKATQVEQDFNTEIGEVNENIGEIEENINNINTNIGEVNEDIFDLKHEMMTMGENLFTFPTFEGDVDLTSTTHTSNTDPTLFIADNPFKEGANEPFVELNTAYKVKNESDRVLRIFGRTDGSGNRDLSQRAEFEFPVHSGEKFNISFDFRKTFANGTATVGLMIYDQYNNYKIRNWINKGFNEADENWKRVNTVVEVPEGNYKYGKFFVSYQQAKSTETYVDFDNIYITRADVSQTLIEVNDGKIKTLISEQGKTNQRLETAEGSIQKIENLEGSNTLVNTVNGMKQQIQDNTGNVTTIQATVNGIQSQVSSNTGNISTLTQTSNKLTSEISTAKGDISTLKQTANGLQTRVEAYGNVWLTPDFETTKLSEYTTAMDNWSTIFIDDNNLRTTATEQAKYGEPFKRQNPSFKALRINGNKDKNIDVYQKPEYNIKIYPGDIFDISFDFVKTTYGSVSVGFKIYRSDGTYTWKSIIVGDKFNTGGNWRHFDGQLELPTDGNFIEAQPYVAYNKTDSLETNYLYIDNIIIKRSSGTQAGQYSQITQTAQGIQTQVSSQQGQISSLTQTANGIKTQVSSLSQNGVNLFPNGIFYDSTLTNYFYGIPDNNKFSVVSKNESDGGNYGSEKCLKMVSTKARDIALRANSFIPCKAGNTLLVSFDYFNKGNAADIIFTARFRYNDGTADKWVSRVVTKEQSTTWKQYTNEIKVPNNATSVQLMIGTSVSSEEGVISYVDNILVNSTEVSGSEFTQTVEGIQTTVTGNSQNISKVTQTAEGLKTEISKQGTQLNITTQTANTALTNIQNLESKTNTKFLQTDELLALQANKIGVYYPDGSFECGDVNKYYEDYTNGGNVKYATLGKVEDVYRLWIRNQNSTTSENYGVKLKDLIEIVNNKEKVKLNFDFRLFWNTSSSEGVAEVLLTEYDDKKQAIKDNVIRATTEEKLKWVSSKNEFTLLPNTKYVKVLFRNRNISGNKFEASYTNVTLSNGDNNIGGMLAIANDNINLSVKKGNVISQINISDEDITISGEKIHITGATDIDNAVITDAMIANLSASKLTAGTIDAKKINVVDLDVNKLTGNKANFIQAGFTSANSSLSIDSKGIKTQNSHARTALNAGRLEFRDSGSNGGDLVGAIETADLLDINGLDDTMLLTVLGRRQLSIAFDSGSGRKSALSFKQRDGRNLMYIEDSSFRIATHNNYKINLGEMINSDNKKTYPSIANDSGTVGMMMGVKDLVFKDGYSDNNGSKQMTLNRIRSGQLDSLKTPTGKFTLTIKDGTINGNPSLVFSGSATENTNFIGMNNADIWLSAANSVYISDRASKRYALEDLYWGRMGQLEGVSGDNKYKLVYRYSPVMGVKNEQCLLLGGSNINNSSVKEEDRNYIAMNNANIYLKAKYDVIFDDRYGSGMTLNQIRQKLNRSAYALDTDNGAIELSSEEIDGQQAKVLTDETGSGIAFVDGKLMFKDSSMPTTYSNTGWLSLSEIIQEINKGE